MAGWTGRALARLLMIPPATVTSWISSGLVTPDAYGRGRGGHAIGMSGLLEMVAIVEMRNAGLPTQSIWRVVEALRELSVHARPLAGLTLVIIGNDAVWKDATELYAMPISALHRPGQRLSILPIGEQHAALLHQLLLEENSLKGTLLRSRTGRE